jgi:PKHD-type hydroxylase
MLLCIADILEPHETAAMRRRVEDITFVDGSSTAGWAARLVKDNERADADDPRLAELRMEIEERILANELFQLAVRPKALTPLMISRYRAGKQYGIHVDDALMRGMRVDVSFTLFLTEPETYEGGALVIDSAAGEQAFKLAAGCMIVYPSNTLHRVAPVQSGERLAVVGWARSFVRSPERREILFGLDTARREVFESQGKSSSFDQLSKCSANLLRMWAED